ncbi:MAG: NADH-quinone oxidoreductase subunit NuoG [Armatimonadota bacterium]|jgi:NADH-quinone oxidoreductase subunit G
MADSNDRVTLTMDGREVSVPRGTLVIEVADMLGIDIPRFCYEERLDPSGNCRMCMVEIEGMPKLQTSCTTEVAEGMVVRTETASVIQARAEQLEFLLLNHPLDCPVCDKGGECPLQDLSFAHARSPGRFPLEWKRHWDKPIELGATIYLDRERCIHCARCVRFCEEIAWHPVLKLRERGAFCEIFTDSDPPCDTQFSGNTIDICPVGALTSRQFRFRARPWQLTDTPSICARCGCGCNVTLQAREGGLERLLPRENPDIADGWLCDRGRFGSVDEANDAERLTEPLIRDEDELVGASWERAFEAAAEAIGAADGLCIVAGPTLTDEELHALQGLAEKLDAKVRAWPEQELLRAAYARGLTTARIADIDDADAIVLLCADVSADLPIVELRVKKAVRRRGARLIVVHPEETELGRHADEWLQGGGELLRQAMARIRDRERPVVIVGRGACEAAEAGVTELLDSLAAVAEESGTKLLFVAEHGNSMGLAVHGIEALAPDDVHGALYVLGADVADDPVPGEELRSADTVIYQGIARTATARAADVVLPGADFAERNGTYTNTEGTEQGIARAAKPPGDARPDLDIIRDLRLRLVKQ